MDLHWLEDALLAYKDLAYRVCQRIVQDEHDTADAFQNGCLTLIRHAADYRHGKEMSMRAWICQAMRWAALDIVRRRRNLARLPEDIESKSAGCHERGMAETERKELTAHLRTALGTLSEVDRMALQLRYYEGWSDREIAQTLGCRENAATKRIGRALERLRLKMGQAIAMALLLALFAEEGRAESTTRAPTGFLEWIRNTFAAPPVFPMTRAERLWKGVKHMARNPIAVATFFLIPAALMWCYAKGGVCGAEKRGMASGTDENGNAVATATVPKADKPSKKLPETPAFSVVSKVAAHRGTDAKAKPTPTTGEETRKPVEEESEAAITPLKILWHVKSNYCSFQAPAPAVGGGVAVQTTSEGLYALDARTGKQCWRVSGDYQHSVPVIREGVVYALAMGDMMEQVNAEDEGNSCKKVAAYDLKTGTALWTHSLEDLNLKFKWMDSSLAFDGKSGNVLVGTRGGMLVAVTKDGKRAWAVEVGSEDSEKGDTVFSPSIDTESGLVFSGIWDKSLVAIQAETGGVKWARGVTEINYQPPVIYRGNLYVAAGKVVQQYNLLNGEPGWSVSFAESIIGEPLPVPGEGLLIAQGKRHIFGMNIADGVQRWSVPCHRFGYTACALENDIVFAGSDDGELLAVRAKDGAVLYRQDMNLLPEAKDAPKVEVNVPVDATGESTTTTKAEKNKDGVGDGVIEIRSEDAKNGSAARISRKCLGTMGVPTISGGVLYVTTGSGWTIALDISTIGQKKAKE